MKNRWCKDCNSVCGIADRNEGSLWLQVEQGRIGVATIYLGGGVCGALGASLLQPSLYLVGASAGVYALLTSHLAHLYLVSERKSFSISKNEAQTT